MALSAHGVINATNGLQGATAQHKTKEELQNASGDNPSGAQVEHLAAGSQGGPSRTNFLGAGHA